MMKRVLRNYELIDRISAGGMGTVYRAMQLSLRRVVAVKELHPQLSNHSEYTERFEREAMVLGAMFNENIVGIIDFGREDGSYYIVMEYIDGISLADILDRSSTLCESTALTIIEHIARGLAYAHSKGVVHRDLKPANILISGEGIVKITDFGLCRPLKDSNITQHTTLMGTPRYMSPEQAQGKPVDERSDIYSLGILFFELLTGFYAIWNENTIDILQEVAYGDRLDVSRLPTETNPQIRNIIANATSKDPSERFASCKDILAAIRKLRISDSRFNNPACLDEIVSQMIIPVKPGDLTKDFVPQKNDSSETQTAIDRIPETTRFDDTRHLYIFSGSIHDIEPSRFVVRYSPFYVRTEPYEKLEKSVDELRNVLIVGRPGSGKTRAAYEIIMSMKDTRKDWQVFIPKPQEVQDISSILKQIERPNCLILWEDIDQFISFWDPKAIFSELENSLDNLQIIGTLRTGNEFNAVESLRTDWFYFFDERIFLRDLTDVQAMKIAGNVPNISTSDFDGTPGSILLDLGKVRSRYRSIVNPSRSILKVLKMFSIVGIKNIEKELLIKAANTIFGCRLDKFSMREAIHNLKDNALIASTDDTCRFYHPSYAEKVLTDYENEELCEDLDALLHILKEDRNPYHLVSIANYLSSENSLVNTIELTTLAIEIRPDLARAYSIRGMARCNSGDYDGAISDYDMAISLKPMNADFFNNRGVSKSYSGDIQGAISDYNMAISLKLDHAETYFNRATVYYNSGEYKKALKDYNRTIELSPEYAPAYNNRAILRSYELNDVEGALDDYAKAIKLSPSYEFAWYNRANVLLYNLKDPHKALADYDKVIELSPDFAEGWYNRGMALLHLMEPQKALDSFEKAIELSDWGSETLANDTDIIDFMKDHPGVFGLFRFRIEQLLKPHHLNLDISAIKKSA